MSAIVDQSGFEVTQESYTTLWRAVDVLTSKTVAQAGHLARVEGMLERAMRRINHDVSCSREYDATLRDCPCRLHSLRADYDKLKAEKAGRE